jgi:hypothetical protein
MQPTESNITIPVLQQMKRDRQKIVGVVAWDVQIAQILDVGFLKRKVRVLGLYSEGQLYSEDPARAVSAGCHPMP